MAPSRKAAPGMQGPNRSYYPFRDFGDDDEPKPEPAPIPIRIVDSPPQAGDTVPEADETTANNNDTNEKAKSDDFYAAWDKFIIAQPKRARKAQRAAKLLHEEKELVEKSQPEGLHFKVNAAQSWEDAADECRLKVTAIVEECKRLNQKYRDALFDLEESYDCLQGLGGDFLGIEAVDQPPWIKRIGDIFEKPQFFVDGASTAEVHQGRLGDCWFLSALTSVSADKRILDKLCVAKDEIVGVYGFVFYRDGEWIHEVIDDKLYIRVGDDDDLEIVANLTYKDPSPISLRHDKDKLKDQMQKGAEALFFSHSKSEETWVPLIEKAYAKAHGDYGAIEGGWPSEGIEDLTGGVATSINPEDIMDKDKFWKDQMLEVNKKYLFNCATGWTWKKGLASSHAYTVLETFEEGDLKLVKVRNPWGEGEWTEDWSDGSKQWTPEMMKKLNHTFGDDGIFWISYKDWLKNFPSIHRVRLFDHEWQISQRWTCVNVPWTVDYMDTKFEIDVATRGPLVVVLSQPDERYFRGLAGRFMYALHFRLYRAGESGHKYLVRSMHSSGGDNMRTRSVSAELEDVKPGKYFIIFKVTANRNDYARRPEEAIVQFATLRKEKLRAVGQRYDHAQTKGNLRAVEKGERKKQRNEVFEKTVEAAKRNRKNLKLAQARARLRKKRVQDAITAQRKAIFDRAAEKRKAQQTEDAKNNISTPAQANQAQAIVTAQPVETAVGARADADASNTSTTSTDGSQAVLTPSTEGSASDKPVAAPGVSATANDTEVNKVDQVATDVAKLELATPEKPATPDDSVKGQTAASAAGPVVTVADAAAGVSTPANQAPAAGVVDQPSTGVATQAGLAPATVLVPGQAADLAITAVLPGGPLPGIDPVWEEPPEQPDELDDDDFDWDSDIDGPINSDTSSRTTEAGRDIDIFADDPWKALCVLGLRVYSKGDVKIEVKHATEEGDGDVEIV